MADQWFYDQSRNMRFKVDPVNRKYLFEDGSVMPAQPPTSAQSASVAVSNHQIVHNGTNSHAAAQTTYSLPSNVNHGHSYHQNALEYPSGPSYLAGGWPYYPQVNRVQRQANTPHLHWDQSSTIQQYGNAFPSGYQRTHANQQNYNTPPNPHYSYPVSTNVFPSHDSKLNQNYIVAPSTSIMGPQALLSVEPPNGQQLQEVGGKVERCASVSLLPTDLRFRGRAFHNKVSGTAGRSEKLHSSFKVQWPGTEFFKIGVVFRVLWPEPAGNDEGATKVTVHQFPKEKVYVKIRWFVVIREGSESCICLSIQTYGGKGVPLNKDKSQHAIMYSEEPEPQPQPTERSTGPNDPEMGRAIKVQKKEEWKQMDPLSRVNFFKLYTVEHNVKVEKFGKVHPDHEHNLVSQFQYLWLNPKETKLLCNAS